MNIFKVKWNSNIFGNVEKKLFCTTRDLIVNNKPINTGLITLPDHTTRHIPVIWGDGIGSEITPVALSVLDHAMRKAYGKKKKIFWAKVMGGEEAFKKTGKYLPSEVLEAIKIHKVALKGPLTTPIGEGHESLNVSLRRKFDLFACVRPFKHYPGVPSSFTRLEDLNITVFRENIEDTYVGIEFSPKSDEWPALMNIFMNNPEMKAKIPFPKTTAIGIKILSKEGSERIARAAINHAISYNKPSVTFLHKGNIMKKTEGAFKKWCYDLATNEFGDKTTTEKNKAEGKVLIQHMITDNFVHQCKIWPRQFSVVVATNFTGDIISDDLAGIVGGLGVSPGANINYQTGSAIFEATHGTAPDIIEKKLANPTSLILSGEMMLRYLGWDKAADLIDTSVKQTFKEKIGTSDLFRRDPKATVVDTEKFGHELIKRM